MVLAVPVDLNLLFVLDLVYLQVLLHLEVQCLRLDLSDLGFQMYQTVLDFHLVQGVLITLWVLESQVNHLNQMHQ